MIRLNPKKLHKMDSGPPKACWEIALRVVVQGHVAKYVTFIKAGN